MEDNMVRKIIAVITVISFVFAQVGFADVATNIVADGRTNTTVSQSGNTHTIETITVHERTGFNAFSDFNLANGDIANLILPSNTDNLVNAVTGGNKTFIEGTLNAYKNGKIGGNVFFLNPNGIMIGATGIVNVGALTLATPRREYIDRILENNSYFNAGNFSQAILSGDVPLSPNGNISIKGKINAYYGVAVHSNDVDIKGGTDKI
jgi:filamentous hemagglutinin family protein